MAEQTGVTTTPTTTEHHASPASSSDGKKGSFFKRNKALVIGGGALAAVLLMGRNQSSSNGGGTGAANTAYEQGVTDGLNAGAASTGTGGSTDSGMDDGGGGGNSGSGGGLGEGSSGGTAGAGGTDGTASSTPPAVTVNVNSASPKSAATKGKVTKKAAPKSAPKPKTAPKTTPKPAAKDGKHPATPKKTSTGTKKKSPAMVESMEGAGSGVTVMGRDFPGALSHRLGPPTREGASVTRTVTLDYGGHTDTHKVIGNGDAWIDNVRGANPPRRGVPWLNSGQAR